MKPSDWFRSIANEVRSDPTRWTQRLYARDKHGNMVSPVSQFATCWCAQGFIFRDFKDNCARSEVYRIASAAIADCGADIPLYNDSRRSPDEFVQWMEKAALEAEQRGQ